MENEEQINQQVQKELDGMMLDLYSNIDFEPNIVQDGRTAYYPISLQIARFVSNQQYKEFRLSYESNSIGTYVTMYYERLLQDGGYFSSPKYAPKQCIGVLWHDIEANRVMLRKTNVNPEIHEFHADSKRDMCECFGVQYEIFKHLRDNDLIQIHTIERKVRKNQRYVYTITKFKAVKNGRFLHFKGYGTQFFIPKADFKCVEGKEVKNKKKAIAKDSKKK